MIDYSKGKIYTIRYRNDSSLIYVGSTCQELYKRWGKHKENILYQQTKERKTLFYEKIRETNDLDNWYIELYESYPCNTKQELNKREGEVQREIATLNMKISGRTQKEWVNENKNKTNEYKKTYRNNNKDSLNEKSNTRYHNMPKITCECGCEIKNQNLNRHLKTKKHTDKLTTVVNC